MEFQLINSDTWTCPVGYGQYIDWSANSGTVVSVGVQNFGVVLDFYASQMFVKGQRDVFVEVNNTSKEDVSWRIWCVVATDGTAPVSGTGKVESRQIPKPAT
jgi:hypothetical protein